MPTMSAAADDSHSAANVASSGSAALDDFRTLFEFLPIGAYRSSPEGRQLRANPALVRLNGYSSEAHMLASVRDIANEWYALPGRRDEFSQAMEREGHVQGFVSEVFGHHSRRRMWVRENAHAVRDAAGCIAYYEGTVEEVTEHLESARAVARSEGYLRQIAQHVPGMIYRVHVNREGVVRYSFVSEGIRPLYGLAPQVLLDQPRVLRQYRHPDDGPRVDEAVAAAWACDGPLSVDYRIVLPDGSVKWLQMSSSATIEDDGGRVRVGVLLDVTARRAAEAELRDTEARWKLALDSIGDGIWDWDLVSGREVLSERCLEIHGLAGAELPEHHHALDERTHPDDVAAMRRDRQLHFDGVTPVYVNEHRVRHIDGSWKWVLSRGVVIRRDAQGRPLRMIGTHTDITERRQAEALRAERDRAAASQQAMTTFLSRVSHELRTPLNAILGFTQLMQTDCHTLQHHRPWLNEVMNSGQHLLGLVNDILDLTGAQSGQLQVQLAPVAWLPVLQECLGMLTNEIRAAGLELRDACTLPVHAEGDAPAQPMVQADRLRLKQVLSNLLSNAVKYNRRGGTLSVTFGETSAEAGDEVLITIGDEGEGLTPEQLARLFTPFERLGAQHRGIAGAGLGLALSRQLAQAMGGDIEVASAPGQGSSFTLRLRRAGSR